MLFGFISLRNSILFYSYMINRMFAKSSWMQLLITLINVPGNNLSILYHPSTRPNSINQSFWITSSFPPRFFLPILSLAQFSSYVIISEISLARDSQSINSFQWVVSSFCGMVYIYLSICLYHPTFLAPLQ